MYYSLLRILPVSFVPRSPSHPNKMCQQLPYLSVNNKNQLLANQERYSTIEIERLGK